MRLPLLELKLTTELFREWKLPPVIMAPSHTMMAMMIMRMKKKRLDAF